MKENWFQRAHVIDT